MRISKCTKRHKQISKKPKTNKFLTAKSVRLWRGYKLPPTMSRSAIQRFKGALMGYNALELPMHHWPDARWGKFSILEISLKKQFHFNQ